MGASLARSSSMSWAEQPRPSLPLFHMARRTTVLRAGKRWKCVKSSRSWYLMGSQPSSKRSRRGVAAAMASRARRPMAPPSSRMSFRKTRLRSCLTEAPLPLPPKASTRTSSMPTWRLRHRRPPRARRSRLGKAARRSPRAPGDARSRRRSSARCRRRLPARAPRPTSVRGRFDGARWRASRRHPFFFFRPPWCCLLFSSSSSSPRSSSSSFL
mmetsp:Transcript_13413/g.43709  ORF Transcript_13413/g.43709 Transcript_13413/m.43709 type:complete len:213 (-) Transcript_13413:1579-2217(-)